MDADTAEIAPRLEYPFSGVPAEGTTIPVAPGVLWIRLPLPFALTHINVWAIDDGDGWAIVDTGTRTETTAALWNTLFAKELGGRPVTRVFVTHMHPDHIGMAGWLTRKFSCRLWITRLEYMTCRVLASDTGREAPPEALAFYQRAGWSPASIETYGARFGNFGKNIHPLPASFKRISDGHSFPIGAHRWQVVVGTGHSPEHACLYCPELKLLISGDQMLPKISSNVSVHPPEPDADPMADWLASLAKLKRQVPADVLVLPAHNECFRGLHARIDALERGQTRALSRLLDGLARPRRVIDCFGRLFARPIGEDDPILLSLATGETLACLNYLMNRGDVVAEADSAGVLWYRQTGLEAAAP